MINKYRIDIHSTHILGKAKYKGSDVNKTKPDLHLLMPDCDPDQHKEYVETFKKYQKKDIEMPSFAPKEEKENLSAEDLLKKLNLSSQAPSTSSKPKVVEVVKPSYLIPSSVAQTNEKEPKKTGTTVIKSIDDYNNSKSSSKLIPSSEATFGISHKKGNIRIVLGIPEEENLASIDLQVNSTSFVMESDKYY
mmetsp:Transcript_805/g.793  ORF Transcript_805/g.793 Transcript_805/m.793 type:complete len:192 (+) Transcript_805:703-1278(+)